MPNPIIDSDGNKLWYNDVGQIHREDGPAFEAVNGSKEWWLNGKCHREDGPAVEWASGSKAWWLNDKLHREDGPAVENADGSKSWWLNGGRHRTDGPAVEYNNGDKEWYLNDKQYTEEDFLKATRPATELTVAEIEQLLGYAIKVVK